MVHNLICFASSVDNAIQLYVHSMKLCNPQYKSAINIASKVATITIFMSFIIVGAKIATANIGVKFGGWGIILLAARTSTNPPNHNIFSTMNM